MCPYNCLRNEASNVKEEDKYKHLSIIKVILGTHRLVNMFYN